MRSLTADVFPHHVSPDPNGIRPLIPLDAHASWACRLLQSLEEVSEVEYERLWGDESARRAAAADSGRVQAVSAAEVARKARSLLR